MSAVLSLLARVRQLEKGRESPWDRLVGPIEEFDAFINDGIAQGQLDPRDAPIVIASVRRWVREF